MRIDKTDIIILFLCIGTCIFFYNKIVPKDYFDYDEADHMFAVSKGLYTNYIDENTIPFLTFLKLGIQQGLQNQNRSSLSEYIRASDDITFYRHYHGPFYYYGLIISRYFLGDDEYTARWTSLLFLIATIIAVYIGCLSLSQENVRVAAIIASVLLMSSSVSIITAAQISAHGLYTLTSIITLFFIAKLLQTNDLRYWYCTIVVLALSFSVMEYAPLLLVTFAICTFIQRRKLFVKWSSQNYRRLLITSVVLFVGVIFIVWPGAWLKLSLVKNYMFFAYVILAREGEFGTQNFWEVWWQRLSDSPLTYILIIPVIFVAFLNIKRRIFYLPFLLYSILMIIITFRNTASSLTYISSLLPPLFILSGLMLAEYLKDSREFVKIGVSALIICAFITHMWFYLIMDRSKVESYTPLKHLVNYLRTHHIDDNKLLVDRRLLPTLHYYFPHKELDSYRDKSNDSGSIIRLLQKSSYDGIIYIGRNNHESEAVLQQTVSFQPEIITKHPLLERRIIYYKITAGRP